MNMRALPSVALRQARDPWPARLVAVAPGLCAVLFDTEAGPARGPRLSARLDGMAPPRPSLSTSLELCSGRRRHVLLLGLDAATVAARNVRLAAAGEEAAINPDWLRSPLAPPAALTAGLTETSANRLIRLLLSAGAAPSGAPPGARARAVLDFLDVTPVPCRSRLPLGAAGGFLVYRLPGAGDLGEMLIPGAAPGRAPAPARHVETHDQGRDVLLFVPGRVPEIGVLCLGARRLLLAAPEAGSVARPLVPFLGRMPATARAFAEAIIAREAETDPVAAATLRELRHPGPAPSATPLHLSTTPAGALLALDIDDPAGLLAGVRVERGGAAVTLPIPPDGRLAAFAALPGDGPATPRLLYRSGRLRRPRTGPAAPYRGEAPAGFRVEDAAAIALARRAQPAWRGEARVTEWNGLAAPRFAVIAPLGSNLDVILARAAILAREPAGNRVETIYHAVEGPLAEAAARGMAETARIFGAALRLVTTPAEATPADRLRAALGAARADRLALVGADVLPGAPGWLATCAAAVGGRAPRLRAAILLGIDGAILRAGGAAALEGLPAGFLPARAAVATHVCAECALLNRAATDALADLTSAYPNPDILLTLLARRLGALGRPARTVPEARFIRYAEPPRPDPLGAAIDAAALAGESIG